MKYRNGFISNSSSCAFVVYGKRLERYEIKRILKTIYDYYKEHPEDEKSSYFTEDIDFEEMDNWELTDYLDACGVNAHSSEEDASGDDAFFIGGGEYIEYLNELDLDDMKSTYEESMNVLKEKFGIDISSGNTGLYGMRVPC